MDLKVDAYLCNPTDPKKCITVKNVVVDTGATSTVLPRSVAEKIGIAASTTTPVLESLTGESINGSREKIAVAISRRARASMTEINAVVVADGKVKEPLLGMDYLRAANCKLDLGRNKLTCRVKKAK